MLKVIKFGGSSLCSAECFQKAAETVKNDGFCRFVVVSAPGKRNEKDEKITDLLKLYVSCDSHTARIALKRVVKRFENIVDELGLGRAIVDETLNFTRSCREFAEDYTVSRGEYFSARVMSELLGWEIVNAEKIIVFDRRGKFDAEKSVESARRTLSLKNRAVIPGFYGRTESGEVKTLPRGGSDVTGAVVARAVNADLYCNSTDVDGVFKADPNLIKNPPLVKKLTYNELYGLALAGAKVMHPGAVSVMSGSGIPIEVKNTFGTYPGTIVVPAVRHPNSCGPVDGISGKNGLIAVAGVGISSDASAVKRIRRVLTSENIKFKTVRKTCNNDCVMARVKAEECERAVKLLYDEFFG